MVCYTVQVYIKEDADSASTHPGLHIALIGEAGEMAKRELVRTAEPVADDGVVKVHTTHIDVCIIAPIEFRLNSF